MLFISLDRKVCLSEPKLNSVNLVAKTVVLENTQKKFKYKAYDVARKLINTVDKSNTWCKGHRGS